MLLVIYPGFSSPSALQHYASDYIGGMMQSKAQGLFEGSHVLIAYTTRWRATKRLANLLLLGTSTTVFHSPLLLLVIVVSPNKFGRPASWTHHVCWHRTQIPFAPSRRETSPSWLECRRARCSSTPFKHLGRSRSTGSGCCCRGFCYTSGHTGSRE